MISKPCEVCGQPMMKRYPSDLRRMHGACRRVNEVKRGILSRDERLEPLLARMSWGEQQRFMEGYRLGTRWAIARYSSRLQRRKCAA
jgi:hypothetical protein